MKKSLPVLEVKKALPILSCLLIALLAGGCGARGDTGMFSAFHAKKVVGKTVSPEDIVGFTYIRENINYDAWYRRYRFCVENGKYLFRYEIRERPDAYGPTTPDDVTAEGAVELSAERWAEFLASLDGGTVTKKSDSTETGGTGPWMDVTWGNGNNKFRRFEFGDLSVRAAFEDLCLRLTAELPGERQTQAPGDADAGAEG